MKIFRKFAIILSNNRKVLNFSKKSSASFSNFKPLQLQYPEKTIRKKAEYIWKCLSRNKFSIRKIWISLSRFESLSSLMHVQIFVQDLNLNIGFLFFHESERLISKSIDLVFINSKRTSISKSCSTYVRIFLVFLLLTFIYGFIFLDQGTLVDFSYTVRLRVRMSKTLVIPSSRRLAEHLEVFLTF